MRKTINLPTTLRVDLVKGNPKTASRNFGLGAGKTQTAGYGNGLTGRPSTTQAGTNGSQLRMKTVSSRVVYPLTVNVKRGTKIQYGMANPALENITLFAKNHKWRLKVEVPPNQFKIMKLRREMKHILN